MLITENPTNEKILQLIGHSEMKAVKWLKDLDGGDVYYWSSDWRPHDSAAGEFRINEYENGIVNII